MSLLYEGKAKRVFTTNIDGQLRVEYKDEVTAGNGNPSTQQRDAQKGLNIILTIKFQTILSNLW